MLMFVKQSYPLLKRTFSTHDNSLLAHCLNERCLLKLSGNDASSYMQGLTTNDMKHLEGGASSMFTMFLNSKGRVMFDSIMYNCNTENTYFIECDSAASSTLKDHLLRYKVRKKINIDSVSDEFNIWAIAKSNYLENLKDVSEYNKVATLITNKLSQIIITGDPRLSSMGLRIIAPKDLNICNEIEKMTDIKVKEKNFYKLLRYKLGIGEGMQELPFEKCFPMEINGDYLHGISFHKGCYVGQELTARTYHTGVIRKRLMPLDFNEEMKISELGIPIFAASQTNKSIGKLYGIEQTSGIGLLRIEEALKADELMISNKKGTTHRPFWWPTEAPKTRIKIG